MKTFFTSALMLLISFTMIAQTSFYDFKVKTLEGEDFDLASLKGKKVLVVNTASKCGYTPQYEDLEALYEEFGGDDFVVIGFPANNFMKQEPGTNEEIREFCTKNYISESYPHWPKYHNRFQWFFQDIQNVPY